MVAISPLEKKKEEKKKIKPFTSSDPLEWSPL